MSVLPIFEYQTHEIQLPSSKQFVKFRPFVVKEQKNLMTSLEFDDPVAIINSIVGIVNACTFNKLDIDNLPAADIEYLFLNIKAKSTGDELKIVYTCKNEITKTIINEESSEEITSTDECNTKINVNINLINTKVINTDISNIIKINSTTGLVLKYPNFGTLRKNINLFNSNLSDDDATKLIYTSLDYIFTAESTLKPDVDFNIEDLTIFLDSLTPEVFNNIREFFDNLPQIVYSVDLKCPSCGATETITLNGLDDFLD